MPLPRWVARANKRFTNRFIEPLVGRSRRYAVIRHIGRRSGERYRTPVFLFGEGEHRFVALTYGTGADWVHNILAGGGTCETRDGEASAIEAPIVVGRREAWPHLPAIVRLLLRVTFVRDFLRFVPRRIST